MQIWAESGKSALPICNYSQILYQFLTFTQNLKRSQRDSGQIVLYNNSSFEFIDLVTPIIYFVDTFVALFNNKLWFQMRNIQHDLVVDRHGNILPLHLIAEQKI